MKPYFVCRIIKELKPIEYKHVRECNCIFKQICKQRHQDLLKNEINNAKK